MRKQPFVPSLRAVILLWIVAVLFGLLAVGLITGAIEAQTPAGHVHNSLPARSARLVAGTAWTMVYPRHHWKETAFLDANFLAYAWDARSSMMVFTECVGCAESNPVLGPHPSIATMYAYELGWGFMTNVGTHFLANKAREQHFPVVLTFAPASILTAAQIYAGFWNYGSDGYLLWRACNRNPNCFPHRSTTP